ncbi:sugar transferase [Agromyces albus]|uniref:sugar transferase n=1 Tax=Agromyces albus TaxID=205332 RepID=UPI0027D8412D|nr:sugar transferase [Agromyces albus]
MPTAKWPEVLATRVAITDLAVLVWVVFGTQIAWLGLDSRAVGFSGYRGDIVISYTMVSLLIIAGWMVALELFDTRSVRVLGVGTQEYRAIADSAIRLFGIVAIIAFLFKLDLARGYILISFPLGLLTLLFSRWIWRQWLGVKRRNGEYSSKVLLVGTIDSATTIAREFARTPEAGYQVVGACVSTEAIGGTLPGLDVPTSRGVDRSLEVMRELGADTIVVTSADELDPQRVRQLSWGLVPGSEHLVVAPSLIDIGGPRIHTRPVAGLPLIHVETPKLGGQKAFTKRAFDIVASGALILVLSPVLVFIAIAVKLASPGPVLFKQPRVGLNGDEFKMLKFRSMVVDAEARLKDLEVQQRDAGNTVMFKMKDDPRVTPIGRLLRRFSLDEIPQLFNVLAGNMSLVGPRPPLFREIEHYADHVHRRFLVKPGITGLWQVSGRSNLSWEDTVRLDLYYVENWSVTGDLVILWRTAKAVLASEGAY